MLFDTSMAIIGTKIIFFRLFFLLKNDEKSENFETLFLNNHILLIFYQFN